MVKIKPREVAVQDRLIAALREHGPLNTRRLRELSGPHFEDRPVRHGRKVHINDGSYPFRYTFESCPNCDCVETWDNTRYAGGDVRRLLLRMERDGIVLKIRSPQANNGGDLWMLVE